MTTAPRLLSDLIQRTGVQPLSEIGADPWITGAALDSRRVCPGDLFFALPGERTSGEEFADQAIRRGARAIVAQSPRPNSIDDAIAWVQLAHSRRSAGLLSREYYGRPDESLLLAGITGTNGKTTVAYLVQAIGHAAGKSSGRIGTTGFSMGDEEGPLSHTTPEAPELYRYLAQMRDRNVELVAMEVSSHAMSLHRVEGAQFAVAAFLNLSRDHLDFHRTEREYFEAKARLFDTLPQTSSAVLPADSLDGRAIARRTRATVIRFGNTEDADVRLKNEHCTMEGSSAVLETPAGRLPIRTFMPGRYNLDNIAAAAACALALGLPARSIPEGVLALERVPGRMERIECGQPFSVLVDYAHTEEALQRLLQWVRQAACGRVIVVFGCGGSRDSGKRAPMGRCAAEYAELVFLTSDNPRDEDPQQILEQITAGVAEVNPGLDRCRVIEDREVAIAAAIACAEPEDVVVIAGKGHEDTQTAAGVVRPLDDRKVATEAISRVGYPGGDRAGS